MSVHNPDIIYEKGGLHVLQGSCQRHHTTFQEANVLIDQLLDLETYALLPSRQPTIISMSKLSFGESTQNLPI